MVKSVGRASHSLYPRHDNHLLFRISLQDATFSGDAQDEWVLAKTESGNITFINKVLRVIH